MAIEISMPKNKISFLREDFEDNVRDLQVEPGGVYVFFDNNETCIYVGQSKNLANRLRKHFNSSPFANEIHKIDLYFIRDPFEREIYETFAITSFNGKYNKAKKYKVRKIPPWIREDIEDIDHEIYLLKIERDMIIQEKKQYEYDNFVPRKYNNWKGEYSKAYSEYEEMLEDDFCDEDEDIDDNDYEDDIFYKEKLKEIDSEIKSLKRKKRKLLERLVI